MNGERVTPLRCRRNKSQITQIKRKGLFALSWYPLCDSVIFVGSFLFLTKIIFFGNKLPSISQSGRLRTKLSERDYIINSFDKNILMSYQISCGFLKQKAGESII